MEAVDWFGLMASSSAYCVLLPSLLGVCTLQWFSSRVEWSQLLRILCWELEQIILEVFHTVAMWPCDDRDVRQRAVGEGWLPLISTGVLNARNRTVTVFGFRWQALQVRCIECVYLTLSTCHTATATSCIWSQATCGRESQHAWRASVWWTETGTLCGTPCVWCLPRIAPCYGIDFGSLPLPSSKLQVFSTGIKFVLISLVSVVPDWWMLHVHHVYSDRSILLVEVRRDITVHDIISTFGKFY